METQLDIVLPCYNPQKGWIETIVNSCKKLDSLLLGVNYRLIIVNDGSKKEVSQSEVDLLEEILPNATFLSYSTNKGKGFALRTGVKQSTAPYTIVTDIDFPYLEENLAFFYNSLVNSEADIICGIRNDFYYRDVPPLRVKISKNLKRLNRGLLKLKVDDTQCGIKGFSNKGKEVFLQTTINRYLFDLEFIFLASNNKRINIIGRRVSLKPGIIFSKMNYKIIIGEGFNFLKVYFKNLLGYKPKVSSDNFNSAREVKQEVAEPYLK